MDDKVMKSEIAKRWTEGAPDYDRHVSHGIHLDEEKQAWMKALSNAIPKKSLSILDVGCGTGAMGLLLAEMGHTVTGLDLSEGMMEVGRKKNADLDLTMTFQQGDAEQLPFEDEMFDVVINRHLLWTLPHPTTALENWIRVLKPSGTLIVIDGEWHNKSAIDEMRSKISLGIAKRVEEHPHGSHEYSEELRASLPNHGGLPHTKVQELFTSYGLQDIRMNDLRDILKIQQKELAWYARIAPQSPYYLVAGTKPSVSGDEKQ